MVEDRGKKRVGETTQEWCERQAAYQREGHADSSKPWPTVAPGYEFREEALRAASRIVAARAGVKVDGVMAADNVATIVLAEQFARWLETGER